MSVNQQEFKNLHEQYRDRLVNSMTAFAKNRDEAEDITATAFAAAFEKRDSFHGDSSLYTWVHAIALNEAKDRRRQRQTVSLDAVEGSECADVAEPDLLVQKLARAECCQKLRQALRQIPSIYRRTLVDHFVREYPVRRMARRDRVPVGTILSRIFTAKRLLRAAWES